MRGFWTPYKNEKIDIFVNAQKGAYVFGARLGQPSLSCA